MIIQKEKNGTELTLILEGWLDTVTSPELTKALSGELDTITKLNLDIAKLEYITSAGLRVLLSTHKAMNKKEGMFIRHANNDIKEMFEFTGFMDVMNLVD